MPEADTYTGLESPKMEDTGNAQNPREAGEGLLRRFHQEAMEALGKEKKNGGHSASAPQATS